MSAFHQQQDLSAFDTDIILAPVVPGLGPEASRADQVFLEGGMVRVFDDAAVTALLFRILTANGAPTIAIGIYQETNGRSGVARLITSAVAVAVPAAPLNLQISVPLGILAQGVAYILHGRDSPAGSYTVRAWGVQNYDLMNDNMVAGTRPTSFTTLLTASAGLPAQFDPVADAIPSTLNTIPFLRGRIL